MREEKRLLGCFSISWLFSPLRFGLPHAAEKKAEFFVLGLRVYHSDETGDTADAAEENDPDYPESMTSEDFEPGTVETAVAKQQKAITEQVEISSEHLKVTGPVSNRKGVPPQRENKRHRNVPEEEQRVMRCRGRSRRRFRKQRSQIPTGTRRLQGFIRLAEIWFDSLQDERTQRFLRLLKREVFRFSRELLPRRMSGTLRFGFADPALTG